MRAGSFSACLKIAELKNSTVTDCVCLIQNTRDLDLAVRHGVPRSTARGWLKQSRANVVSIDVLDMDTEGLQREVLFLRRRVTRLLNMLHLVVVAFKVAEFSFDRVRIPVEPANKGYCGPLSVHERTCHFVMC